MKFCNNILPALLTAVNTVGLIQAFTPGFQSPIITPSSTATSTSLKVSIGLGPDAEEQKDIAASDAEQEEMIEPDHELFRDSRLTDFDRQCDAWFGAILGSDDEQKFLGEVSEEASRRLKTLVKLEREVSFILFVHYGCYFMNACFYKLVIRKINGSKQMMLHFCLFL
jgi:hypothetical protein